MFTETLTRKAAVSAELILQEQLAESPDVVFALECQNVTFSTVLSTNEAPFQLSSLSCQVHPQSEPSKSFFTNLDPRDDTWSLECPFVSRTSTLLTGLSALGNTFSTHARTHLFLITFSSAINSDVLSYSDGTY